MPKIALDFLAVAPPCPMGGAGLGTGDWGGRAREGAQRVYLIGQDERQRGVVKGKDLATKEEHEEKLEDIGGLQ